MYISETELKVRYAETDKMGVVYHSNYLIYFETGRTKFITGCGMSYSDMEKQGVMIPLLESNCKYIQGAKFEDDLVVRTWIKELNPVKVEFNYSIIRKNDEKEITRGSTLHAFVDNEFRIVNLKKKHPDILNKLQSLL